MAVWTGSLSRRMPERCSANLGLNLGPTEEKTKLSGVTYLRKKGLKTLYKDTEASLCISTALQPLQSPIIKGFMRFLEPLQNPFVTVSKSEEKPIKSMVVTHV